MFSIRDYHQALTSGHFPQFAKRAWQDGGHARPLLDDDIPFALRLCHCVIIKCPPDPTANALSVADSIIGHAFPPDATRAIIKGVRDASGKNALHHAGQCGNLDAALYIGNIAEVDKDENTPLHIFAQGSFNRKGNEGLDIAFDIGECGGEEVDLNTKIAGAFLVSAGHSLAFNIDGWLRLLGQTTDSNAAGRTPLEEALASGNITFAENYPTSLVMHNPRQAWDDFILMTRRWHRLLPSFFDAAFATTPFADPYAVASLLLFDGGGTVEQETKRILASIRQRNIPDEILARVVMQAARPLELHDRLLAGLVANGWQWDSADWTNLARFPRFVTMAERRQLGERATRQDGERRGSL